MPLLLILLCFCAANAAFTISPQHLILKVNTGERLGWVELTHIGTSPIAVELTVHERILDLDGSLSVDTLQESKDFLIYPTQILLYPGTKAKAQVVLKGKERITEDKAYILYSREVPFDFPVEEGEEKSRLSASISMHISYRTVIALETNRAGKLSFVSSEALDSGMVELIVENKSPGKVPINQHFYLMAGNKKITEFITSQYSIMPGQKRRFVFEHEKPLTDKEFKYGYGKN